ncbi:MAG: tryptophan synthase subunit alpha, partial [Polyangiaceae bacterium]
MQLAEQLRARRRERAQPLIMGHVVVGHPDLATCSKLVDSMVAAGVDLLELQLPFSEPLADGPVIAHACQRAVQNGVTVDACFELAWQVAQRHSIPLVFVSYYNLVYQRGLARFAEGARAAGVAGVLVPDCPLEESDDYASALREAALAPIFMLSPRSSDERLRALGRAGDGFVYAAARKGVTGLRTEFSLDLARYLERCRRATELPLAVGFGVET